MTTESQAYRLRALNEASLAGIHGRAQREHMKLFDWFDANIDAIADCVSALEGIVNVGDTMPFFATRALCEEALAALTPVPEVAE